MSNEEENDYILKIHLVGNSSAGKLTLLNSLTKGVLENECTAIIKNYFKSKRNKELIK